MYQIAIQFYESGQRLAILKIFEQKIISGAIARQKYYKQCMLNVDGMINSLHDLTFLECFYEATVLGKRYTFRICTLN